MHTVAVELDFMQPLVALRRRIHQSGELELEFLQLDKEIEDFTGQSTTLLPTATGATIGGVVQLVGVNAGLGEQLDRIEQQALALRDHAARGMKFCRDELAENLIDLET